MTDIISELETVLRKEQELLLSGNLADLEELVSRKAQLAEQLAHQKPNVGENVFRELNDKAHHNEALLDAARRGLQAAMSQIRQTTEAREQSTYSKTGERQPLSRSPSSITQKI